MEVYHLSWDEVMQMPLEHVTWLALGPDGLRKQHLRVTARARLNARRDYIERMLKAHGPAGR